MVTTELRDDHGRVMHDLRVSLTDRCNFRCLYCLPETEEAADFYRSKWDALRNPQPAAPRLQPIQYDWKPKSQLLSYEEITRVVRVAVGLGIRKIRLTGGEPLLRRDVPALVKQIAALDGIAERIRALGFPAPYGARAIAALSTIPPVPVG